MSPEEKAKEIFDNFSFNRKRDGSVEYIRLSSDDAKKCAIICVEQIIPCTWKLSTYKKQGVIDVDERTTTDYWLEVKKELESM